MSVQLNTAAGSVKRTGNSETRIKWIDIAKGIGIMLVSFSFGHLRNGDGQSVVFGLFHLNVIDFDFVIQFYAGRVTALMLILLCYVLVYREESYMFPKRSWN